MVISQSKRGMDDSIWMSAPLSWSISVVCNGGGQYGALEQYAEWVGEEERDGNEEEWMARRGMWREVYVGYAEYRLHTDVRRQKSSRRSCPQSLVL